MFIASINQHDEGGTRSRRPHLMDGAPPEGGDAKGTVPPRKPTSSWAPADRKALARSRFFHRLPFCRSPGAPVHTWPIAAHPVRPLPGCCGSKGALRPTCHGICTLPYSLGGPPRSQGFPWPDTPTTTMARLGFRATIGLHNSLLWGPPARPSGLTQPRVAYGRHGHF
jgi:hypothetical protein